MEYYVTNLPEIIAAGFISPIGPGKTVVDAISSWDWIDFIPMSVAYVVISQVGDDICPQDRFGYDPIFESVLTSLQPFPSVRYSNIYKANFLKLFYDFKYSSYFAPIFGMYSWWMWVDHAWAYGNHGFQDATPHYCWQSFSAILYTLIPINWHMKGY